MLKRICFGLLTSALLGACGSNDSTGNPGSVGGNSGSGGMAGSAGTGGTAGTSGNAGSASGGDAGTGPAGLQITELMINPKKVSDEQGEYVELYNGSSSAIDLSGYSLSDGVNNTHVISKSVVVPPQDYVVLARSGNLKTNGGVNADYVYDNFYLSNTQDAVILLDQAKQKVSEVKYDSSWSVTPGKARELSSLSAPLGDPTSWKDAQNRFGSGDLGTPGGPNGYGPVPYQLNASDLGWQDPNLKSSLFFSYFDVPEKVILKSLATAKKSVKVAMFNLRQSSVIKQLGALKQQGVVVEILMDAGQMSKSYNQAKIKEMKNAGLNPLPVKNAKAQNATMHNKFVVIDGVRVLTGSMNYSSNALKLSDEDFLLLDDAKVAKLFDTEFEELKNDGPDQPTAQTSAPLEVLFGTDDKALHANGERAEERQNLDSFGYVRAQPIFLNQGTD